MQQSFLAHLFFNCIIVSFSPLKDESPAIFSFFTQIRAILYFFLAKTPTILGLKENEFL